MKPITPKEVMQKQSIPPEVIEAFNELIIEGFDGKQSCVLQKKVANLAISKLRKAGNTGDVYDKHWLDVENLFRKAGWLVEYDKPAYNEDYEAYFTFKPK